jgi:hypothetical protein
MHHCLVIEGFEEVHENMSEMIKQVANEPSVGLFYVQQHIHNAVPILHEIKAKVVDTTQEEFICTEDMKDAIRSVKSMKGCGPPIIEQMIKKLNSSISLMSSMQQHRGKRQKIKLQNQSIDSILLGKDNIVLTTLGSAFQTASRAAWRSRASDGQEVGGQVTEIGAPNNQNNYEGRENLSSIDVGTSNGFVQSVFKSALQRAGTLGWSSSSINESTPQIGDRMLARGSSSEALEADVAVSNSAHNASAMLQTSMSAAKTVQLENLNAMTMPIHSSKELEGENLLPVDMVLESSDQALELSEDFEQFQADCAAKLEAWLSGADEGSIIPVQEYDMRPVV